VNCELFLIFDFFTLSNVNNYLLYKYINIEKVKSDAEKIKVKRAAELKMIGNHPKQKKLYFEAQKLSVESSLTTTPVKVNNNE
jgi:hypothetical protein